MVATHPGGGGHSANLIVRGVDYSDAGPNSDAASLFKLDQFSVTASRIDPESEIALSEISLAGLETDVHSMASARASGSWD